MSVVNILLKLKNVLGVVINPATEEAVQAVSEKLPASLGRKASAASLAVALSTEQEALLNTSAVVKRTVTASAAGDNTLYTPAAGKKVRLYFFGYSAAAAVSGVTASLKLEGYNTGAAFDAQYLKSPGQPYARNVLAGHRYLEGAVDGRLILNLSAAQAVLANFELEEV